MGENIFSYPVDLEADDGFMDVSLETSLRSGSRDANMESDVFRRGRWRRPLSELSDLHHPFMDTRPIDVIFCLRQHDISAHLMTLFWKLGIQFLGTSSLKRQHIGVVIFGEHHHRADHLLDDTHDFQVVDKGVMSFSYDRPMLAHYLIRLWGVMVMFSVDFISSQRLLEWTQHVCYYQWVNKIQVVWGGLLFFAIDVCITQENGDTLDIYTSIDVFQDESSGVTITHKSQKIDRCMILTHNCLNSDHMSDKIFTIVWSVLKFVVCYYPSHIQGYPFFGIDSIGDSACRNIYLYYFYKMCEMEYYVSTAFEMLAAKMQYFINLELPFSVEMNGEQGSFEMNGEQIPSIECLSVKMRRRYYPVGEYLHDRSLSLPGYSRQVFASQVCSHDLRDIAEGFYIVVTCRLHLHHVSFAVITQDHRQEPILLRTTITDHRFMDRLLCRIASEEYGETTSRRLNHINRGAQNVVSVVVWWCLWRVQRGPSGPVQGCIICSHCTLMVSYFLQ